MRGEWVCVSFGVGGLLWKVEIVCFWLNSEVLVCLYDVRLRSKCERLFSCGLGFE
jgi:hypothetical protein